MENQEVRGIPFPDFIKEWFKKIVITDKKEKKGD